MDVKIKQWNSTLKRSKGMKRSEIKRKAAIKPKAFNHKPRKPLRQASKKRAKQLREYGGGHKEFLSRRENRYCYICIAMSTGLDRETIWSIMLATEAFSDANLKSRPGVVLTPATEIHHRRGRIGRLLNYTKEFIPSCRGCRQAPHDRPAIARSLGLLCEPAEWNVFPSSI